MKYICISRYNTNHWKLFRRNNSTIKFHFLCDNGIIN